MEPEVHQFRFRRVSPDNSVMLCARCAAHVPRQGAVILGQHVGDGMADVTIMHPTCVSPTDSDLGKVTIPGIGEIRLFMERISARDA